MKTRFHYILSLALLVSGIVSCSPSRNSDDDHLVILHTNDTHSSIDPDAKDNGGIARRKVIIDSVRGAHNNVMLIDAGDAVQGSLYFTLFGGEVERVLMNEMNYDIRILGNHEFDRGMNKLAEEWGQVNATRLSTNYDLSGSTLDGLFVPTVMKEINGHKIGFIGLNLDPVGIIFERSCEGVKYLDALEKANEGAAALRADGAEMVIAVSHLGYDGVPGISDLDIAHGSKDIDIIIGGHTHTAIDPSDPSSPAWRVANAEGDSVTIVQTGARSAAVGEIDINLATRTVTPRLIKVDNRLDSRIDTRFAAMIDPYRAAVDSLRAYKIGETANEFERTSTRMLNLFSDFVRERGAEICGKPVDLSIMNKGGIRNSLACGDVTKGEIIDIAPFENRIVVLDIAGSDLLENIGIMTGQDGQGVSSNVRVLFDPETHAINSATIDGRPIDPSRRYRLATIDYLAAGNDYMTPLKKATLIARSNEILYEALIDYIATGRLNGIFANPDDSPRMTAF
ncbi:MAG: bifunctional metallophosphatase/5'-nucleotidase [Duncaniella sp.]|nr:bifunctional metallophosphatase/5'-nucleotidase [Duncaniella sp.]